MINPEQLPERRGAKAFLRAETAGLHARAEAAFEANYALAAPQGIQRFLTCMLGAYRRFGAECDRGSQLACIECRSAELIDALRREVGSEPAREPASEPRWEPGIEPEVGRLPDMAAVAGLSAHSDAYSLGAAYVFEGSAMGAAILKKKIDVAGLPLPRYLSLLTQSSASRWPRFAKTLDVHMESQVNVNVQADQMLTGAVDVFTHLINDAERQE